PAEREALEKALGLDQPLYVQYFAFLKRAISADFGVSTGVLPGRDAMELFLTRLLATVELSALALTLAVVVAIPLGYIAARRRGGPLDTAAIVSSLVGVAVPVFFLAFVLRHVFAIKMGLLPPPGRASWVLPATRVPVLSGLDRPPPREWHAPWPPLKPLILPATALASFPSGVIFRIPRPSVLAVLDEDYVRTARSKGLT